MSFGVIIVSHRRPDRVYTLKTLRKSGYGGPVCILIDNTDPTIEDYKNNFDDVEVFDKEAVAKTTDNADNFQNYRSTIHARNASWAVAEARGWETFLVLDDDYSDFRFKFRDQIYGDWILHKNLGKLFEAVSGFLSSCPPSVKTVTLSQGGDFIGGANGTNAKKITLRRKSMNSFFCRLDRRFRFFSRLNEDVNTYLVLGMRGDIFFMLTQAGLQQHETQTQTGGMSEAYLQSGTYVKSFYTVMHRPDCTRIRPMGPVNPRLHHATTWRAAVPKILRAEP
jgi:hypothetical protein